MSATSSEPRWTFTASWPVDFTDSLLISLSLLNEELANSLNSAAAMVPEARQLFVQHGQEHTVRLSISLTSRGLQRVISIEEHTPSSQLCGSEADKSSGPCSTDTALTGDTQDRDRPTVCGFMITESFMSTPDYGLTTARCSGSSWTTGRRYGAIASLMATGKLTVLGSLRTWFSGLRAWLSRKPPYE